MTQKIITAFKKLKKHPPLVYCITNTVASDINANSLVSLGALPIMSNAKEESEEIVKNSNSLYINIGTVTQEQFNTMLIGGKVANKINVPLILDPVGASATKYRMKVCKEILSSVKTDILKGNAGEIKALAGERLKGTGVDFLGKTTIEENKNLALKCANMYNTVCAITGEIDYVSDGKNVWTIKNGVPLLTKLVGTGCSVGAFCAAFAGVEEDKVCAALTALAAMSIAGEIAYKKSGDNPGTFRFCLMDALYNMTNEILQNNLIIEKI